MKVFLGMIPVALFVAFMISWLEADRCFYCHKTLWPWMPDLRRLNERGLRIGSRVCRKCYGE